MQQQSSHETEATTCLEQQTSVADCESSDEFWKSFHIVKVQETKSELKMPRKGTQQGAVNTKSSVVF